MIVTNWTMKRFQNTVFFTLLCWRITHGLPTPVPSAPATDPPTEQRQQESEQPATAPATAAPAARAKPSKLAMTMLCIMLRRCMRSALYAR